MTDNTIPRSGARSFQNPYGLTSSGQLFYTKGDLAKITDASFYHVNVNGNIVAVDQKVMGQAPIMAEWLIRNADYIEAHCPHFSDQMDELRSILKAMEQ